MYRKGKGGTVIYLFRVSLRRVTLWTCMVIVMGAMLGISWGANTLATQQLFDAAERVLRGQAKLPALIGMLVLLGGVNLVNQVVNCIGNISHSVYLGRANGMFCQMLQKRAGESSLSAYEDQEQLDRMERAKKGMEMAAPTMLIFLLFIGFYVPWGVFMLAYLASLSPSVALILPLSFFPTLAVQFLRTRTVNKLEGKQASLRRENEYYRKCITEREYFKETRAMGAFGYFMAKYRQTLSVLVGLEREAEREIALREAGFKCITAAGYIGSVALLLGFMIKGRISVGAFAAVFASMNSIFSMMEEIVFYNISQLQGNMGAVCNFVSYICDEVSESGKGHPMAGQIEARDISFAYPNAGREAVRNLSLSIKTGETIALIGENGSGKSTLVKLLIGQYFPASGCVLHNGIPTDRYMRSEMSNGLSGVFQQFQKYRLKLAENIFISQTDKSVDKGDIENILDKVGFDRESLDVGLDSMLSKEFGGTDLSGGEWQKVAIARGIYRAHDFIVLDEPVAAIDPLREAEIYKMFAAIAKGKTVVIVTHRLSSVQFADRIAVLQSGSIVEMGTHKELLDNNGVYAQMFDAQREWYKMT